MDEESAYWYYIALGIIIYYLWKWIIGNACVCREDAECIFFQYRTESTNTLPVDRQGNIFTINGDGPTRDPYADFFSYEPSSEDLARIRTQLEKDEKDLPSYDQVMAMSAMNLSTPTASPAPPAVATSGPLFSNSSSSLDSSLTVIPPPMPPSYTEIDLSASTVNAQSTVVGPTTSRAAAEAAAAASVIRVDECGTNSSSSATNNNNPQLSVVLNTSSSVV